MVNKKLVVIGGGASGFFTAVNAVHPNIEIIIIEKTAKLLTKVLVSGGGRCNVTNSCDEISVFSKSYPRGEKFLKKTLHHFGNKETIEWFKKRGVKLIAEDDGRMFPSTNTSQTIADTLIEEAVNSNVVIYTKTSVESVHIVAELFHLKLNNDTTIIADYLCIASGGQQKMQQYDWLRFANTTIIQPVPSLFTFNMPKNEITQLAGISVPNASVKVIGTKLQTHGPLLITHWGLSGPAILKASAWGAILLSERNYDFDIQINWIAAFDEETVINMLIEQGQVFGNTLIVNKNPFKIPNRLWQYFLQTAGIDVNNKWSQLPSKARNVLAKLLTSMQMHVSGKTTFKEEFVTAGGVDVKDVDPNTMMSKAIPNLFFVGEVLNIDGITGGYNFQNAWTTGWIASQAIKKMV